MLHLLPPRLRDKIRVDGACWLWMGALSGSGYGRVWSTEERRVVQAHRYVYTLLVGSVDASLDLDHFRCERKACVHPQHVRPASRRENLLRGETIPAQHRAKRECPAGHEYTEQSTWVRPRDGGRECRTCRNARAAAYYRRRKAAA